MNIIVIGYFGYVTNQLDGQTVRTRSVHALLEEKTNEKIDYFDTQTFKKSKLKLFGMFYKLAKADAVFYIAAQNSLKYLFPVVYIFAKIFRTKINYIAIGGWLFKFLKNKPVHRHMLSKIQGVFVQTNNLYLELKKYQFENVHTLNNFRMLQFPKLDIDRKCSNIIRMVFMARVHPMKGVDVLFRLDRFFKEENFNDFVIDIYGPILDSYRYEFFEKIKNSTVNYCGIVEPSDMYSVLPKYDLMLFPTKYYTEGFPGTILDAYISGLPVIASNWLNAEEFIENGQTGYVVEFDDDYEFVRKVNEVTKNSQVILDLKDNVKIKREEYGSDRAWMVLKRFI